MTYEYTIQIPRSDLCFMVVYSPDEGGYLDEVYALGHMDEQMLIPDTDGLYVSVPVKKGTLDCKVVPLADYLLEQANLEHAERWFERVGEK